MFPFSVITEYDRVRRSMRSQLTVVQDILKEYWFAYLLFIPTLLFLIVLIWVPFVRGIMMSFYQWPILGDPQWIWLGNYEYLFSWRAFYTSFQATIIFGFTTVIQLLIALVAALALSNQKRFTTVINGIFLVPYTMPPVVTGAVWLFLLHPDLGPVFNGMIELGLMETPIYWGTQGPPALATIMGVLAWTFWPFMFLIIFASLENIPKSHYEVAKVYGANPVQSFIHVTLPQLKSAILVAIAIRTVWNLTKVSQPLQLTGGGPGYETSILAILLYRFGWIQGELGRAFAVGIILFAVTLGFVVLFMREFERSSEVGKR